MYSKFVHSPLNPSHQHHCSSILSGICVSSLYLSITTLSTFYMEIIVSFCKHKFKLLHPSVKAFHVLPSDLNIYSLLWHKRIVFSISNTIFGLSHPLLAMFKSESYSNDPMQSSQGHRISVCIFHSGMLDFLAPSLVGSFLSFRSQLKHCPLLSILLTHTTKSSIHFPLLYLLAKSSFEFFNKMIRKKTNKVWSTK